MERVSIGGETERVKEDWQPDNCQQRKMCDGLPFQGGKDWFGAVRAGAGPDEPGIKAKAGRGRLEPDTRTTPAAQTIAKQQEEEQRQEQQQPQNRDQKN